MRALPLAPAMTGLPWHLMGLGLVMSLVVSTLGFKNVAYFVSLGYAGSIATQAAVMPLIYQDTIGGWVLLQSALLLMYGLRLGSFILARARAPSFQSEVAATAARGAKAGGWITIAIWLSVSLLYVVMFLPALLSMSAQAGGQALPSVPAGDAVMAVGLGLEACADWQKSRFKVVNPDRICTVGLYRMVRFPNYFGEMVFWLGVWVSAISAFRSPLAWGLGVLGFACIELIMLGASRRLELKQSSRYGAGSAYQGYARTTPILFPFLPLYSMRLRKPAPQ